MNKIIGFLEQTIVNGVYKRFFYKYKYKGLPTDYQGQAVSDIIKTKLLEKEPCMICRFGKTELSTIVEYLIKTKTIDRSFLWKYNQYISGNIYPQYKNRYLMQNNAGFFPLTDKHLEAFFYRMIEDIKNIDILGSWLKAESEIFELIIKPPIIVFTRDLLPFLHINPWSEALAGKRVLVVHPFQQTIEQQFTKRHLLFKNSRILPEFELITLKAVQSIGGQKSQFETWFDALDYMCEKINCIKCDIAIIGAGAYGLPLASFVKSIGKKSVHLGGATQLLFGIKGKRWDEQSVFRDQLYNEHWVRPSVSEIPNNHKSIEGGCYW